jgi:hypothetical protein
MLQFLKPLWLPCLSVLAINAVVVALWWLPRIRPIGYGRNKWVVVAMHLFAFAFTTVLALREFRQQLLLVEYGSTYHVCFVVGVVLGSAPAFAWCMCVTV